MSFYSSFSIYEWITDALFLPGIVTFCERHCLQYFIKNCTLLIISFFYLCYENSESKSDFNVVSKRTQNRDDVL